MVQPLGGPESQNLLLWDWCGLQKRHLEHSDGLQSGDLCMTYGDRAGVSSPCGTP